MTGVTGGAGSVYPSGATDFASGFVEVHDVIYILISLMFYLLFKSTQKESRKYSAFDLSVTTYHKFSAFDLSLTTYHNFSRYLISV